MAKPSLRRGRVITSNNAIGWSGFLALLTTVLTLALVDAADAHRKRQAQTPPDCPCWKCASDGFDHATVRATYPEQTETWQLKRHPL